MGYLEEAAIIVNPREIEVGGCQRGWLVTFIQRSLILLLMCGSSLPSRAGEVLIETNVGSMRVELFNEQAPETVKNFLSYVDEDGYEGAIFHRVIEGFMIQTGGYRADLDSLPEREGVMNEADNGLKNIRGMLAMARMDEIDSATRQFFINVADNPHLDHQEGSCSRADELERIQAAERGLLKPRTCLSFGYAVFGRVIDGMDVVDAIAQTETDIEEDFLDMPTQRIWIKQVRRP